MDGQNTSLPSVDNHYVILRQNDPFPGLRIHTSDRQEPYRRPDREPTGRIAVSPADKKRRVIGTTLAGAYVQPIPSPGVNHRILLERITPSPAVHGNNQTLEQSRLRERSSSAITIQQDEQTILSPREETCFGRLTPTRPGVTPNWNPWQRAGRNSR